MNLLYFLIVELFIQILWSDKIKILTLIKLDNWFEGLEKPLKYSRKVQLSSNLYILLSYYNGRHFLDIKQKLLYGKHSNLPLFSLISFNQFN